MKSKQTVTKISKWGNGYGIRIPVATLETYQLGEGSEVVLVSESHGVTISPRTPSLVDLSLENIMKGVTPHLIEHEDVESAFGAPQGNEIW